MTQELRAICECGYKAKSWNEETSFRGFIAKAEPNQPVRVSYYSFPFSCSDCRIVFTGNFWAQRYSCEACEGLNVEPYNQGLTTPQLVAATISDPYELRIPALDLNEPKYHCPKCNTRHMVFILMSYSTS